MVKSDYLLKQPKAPNSLKLFIDQRAIPAAINATGAAETILHNLADRARLAPARSGLAAFTTGALIALMIKLSRHNR